MDSYILIREQSIAKKQKEGGQELVEDMNKNLDSLPLAQTQSSWPSFLHHSLPDGSKSDKLHEAAKEFDAALKENITVDNYIKPLYSSLIERANRTSKIESATPLRNTLIKSVVFEAKGNDLLSQKLQLTGAEIPSRTLCPAKMLEMFEILSTE